MNQGGGIGPREEMQICISMLVVAVSPTGACHSHATSRN